MLKEELGLLWSKVPVESLSFVGSFSNHGRDSEKMLPGLEAARSYDTEIYRRLEHDFPKVKFHIAETNWIVEEIGGHRTMYTHGHARGCQPKRNNMNVMVPNWNFLQQMRRQYDFDAFVHGHLHSTGVIRSADFAYMSNGSLVGENGYSNTGGYPGEPAQQNLAIVDLENKQVEKVVTLVA
jgi:predicted phosphodiesterase